MCLAEPFCNFTPQLMEVVASFYNCNDEYNDFKPVICFHNQLDQNVSNLLLLLR